MRVIFDTVVPASVVRGGRGARALYHAAIERRIGIVSSTALSEEHRRVVLRPEVRGAMSADDAAKIIDVLDAISEIVDPVPPYAGALPDENDRHVISLARHVKLPVITNDAGGFPVGIVETITIADLLRTLQLGGLLA